MCVKDKMEKRKKKDEDLEQAKRGLQKAIKKRYESGDGGASLFFFLLFLISLGLIVGGGIVKNIFSILSGTILLIFLYFALN